jgi:hypothetical protein
MLSKSPLPNAARAGFPAFLAARSLAPLPRPAAIPMRWFATAIGASALAVALLMRHQGLAIVADSGAFAGLVALLAGLGMLWRYCRRPASATQRRLRDFAESALLLIAISLLGALGSYAAAAGTSGYCDAALDHADRLLHFNWLALYTLVAGHRSLQWLAEAAYFSIWLTPCLLIGWFAWENRQAQARQFLATFWLAALLTLLLFPLFPARGALAFLWHGPVPYVPVEGIYQGRIIPLLRAHAMSQVDLGNLRGLVCAPSFHTVSAAIFIATAWPERPLRRVIVPLNAAMLLATPVEGTHYLSDMLLGLLVAAVAVLTVRALCPATPAPYLVPA